MEAESRMVYGACELVGLDGTVEVWLEHGDSIMHSD